MANNFESRVRKASEFTLDEFGLSKKTYSRVKNTSPEELILEIRHGSIRVGAWQACYDELYAAADEAGFIRHDFDAKGFGVNFLYKTVFGICLSEPRPYTSLEDFDSNEAYENYRNPSRLQLEAIDKMLSDILTEKEKCVMQLRFGLMDGRRQYLKEVSLECNVSIERVRHIETKSLKKLRYPLNLLRFENIMKFSSEEECQARINCIETELRELHRRRYELEREILNIKNFSPFTDDGDATIPFEIDESLSIESLKLSARTYAVLRYTGIETVGDFVRFCSTYPEDWQLKIQHLGKKSAQEIVEKIANLGWEIPANNLDLS